MDRRPAPVNTAANTTRVSNITPVLTAHEHAGNVYRVQHGRPGGVRSRTKVYGFQLEVVLMVAFKQVAPRLRQRSFAGVAVRAVDCDEDVGVRAAAKLVARLHHDAVLHAAQPYTPSPCLEVKSVDLHRPIIAFIHDTHLCRFVHVGGVALLCGSASGVNDNEPRDARAWNASTSDHTVLLPPTRLVHKWNEPAYPY